MQLLLEPGRDHLEPEALKQDRRGREGLWEEREDADGCAGSAGTGLSPRSPPSLTIWSRHRMLTQRQPPAAGGAGLAEDPGALAGRPLHTQRPAGLY